MEWLRNLWDDYRRELITAAVVIVIVVAYLVTHGFSGGLPSKVQSDVQPVAASSQMVSSSSHPGSGKVVVDVKGAVNKPGVYHLSHGARVQEAVTAAGGLRNDADSNQVNLAKQLLDAQAIYIPAKGEQAPTGMGTATSGSPSSGDSSATTSTDREPVNLNSATKEQLTTITGIGDKKADLILQYRQEHGQFKSIDDLKNINGFGDKTVDKLRDQLAV
ncbi:helix-hairpin-helix domain-containing protein [Limosilactobacillus sp.]|uniref:helix-hairpin-helix domain-containing protein n=1 Tax=Limosilactobacillus sp. TaxID=2773925 RepID=UPI00345E676D